MLLNLRIQNYALIQSLDMDFHAGFSSITGETGTGKSILLGALGLILGGRADTRTIMQGARKCVVEATFDLSGMALEAWFETNELDFDGGECLVRREVADTGKSRAFINDTPVSAALLKELAPHLIDIHSQHQNLLLSQTDFQLNILDVVARNEALRADYGATFQAWHQAKQRLRQFQQDLERQRENYDFALFQLNELTSAQLQAGEQEQLEDEARVLEHAETIKSALYSIDALLSADDHGACIRLSRAERQLSSIANVYAEAGELQERMESCRLEVEDIAATVNSLLDNLNFEPERLEQVNNRLDLINSLQKKHRLPNVEALIALRNKLAEQTRNVEQCDDVLNDLKQACQAAEAQLQTAAQALTASRSQAAARVEQELQNRLVPLGMPNVRFQVEIRSAAQFAASGADDVDFLFCANRNTPMRRLSDVASGGEIARVMLALKALLAQHLNLSTIIFDEIDTGVSGRIAEEMARTMADMSRAERRQVISITHLPQIAAYGDHQYKVYKEDDGDTTVSHIRHLSSEERVTEIANLLSGARLTDAALDNARALLSQRSEAPQLFPSHPTTL